MTRELRILVGTLYSGENEFELSGESLRTQSYPHWDHVVIKDLPNRKAHDCLYKTFMQKSAEYDLFVKLDADMVLISPDALRWLVDVFKSQTSLDHLIVAVEDWASSSQIMGLHVFSNRTRWKLLGDEIFVDEHPQIEGMRMSIKAPDRSIARHTPDPSPFQAFHFGVHRATKVVQEDRSILKLNQVRSQWRLLNAIWGQFVTTKSRRRGLIILGADLVFRGALTTDHVDYTNDDLMRIFEEEYADRTPSELEALLSDRWATKKAREIARLRAIGPIKVLGSIAIHSVWKMRRTLEGHQPQDWQRLQNWEPEKYRSD